MSGRLIIVKPDGTQEVRTWAKSGTPDWQALKDAVGGYIEGVKARFEGKLRDAYVNENGLSEREPVNPYADAFTLDTQFEDQMILGNLVIWVPDPKVRKGPKRVAPDGSVSS